MVKEIGNSEAGGHLFNFRPIGEVTDKFINYTKYQEILKQLHVRTGYSKLNEHTYKKTDTEKTPYSLTVLLEDLKQYTIIWKKNCQDKRQHGEVQMAMDLQKNFCLRSHRRRT